MIKAELELQGSSAAVTCRLGTLQTFDFVLECCHWQPLEKAQRLPLLPATSAKAHVMQLVMLFGSYLYYNYPP